MNLDNLEQLTDAAGTEHGYRWQERCRFSGEPFGIQDADRGQIIVDWPKNAWQYDYPPQEEMIRVVAAYVAAADPQTIKALIAVVRAAPEALAALTAIDEALNGEHDVCDMCVARGPLREALAALEALQ